MKILSLNTRGWDDSTKGPDYPNSSLKGEFDLDLIQETKRQSIEAYTLKIYGVVTTYVRYKSYLTCSQGAHS